MKKNDSTLSARREFIQKTVNENKGEKIESVVRDIARNLFISESTVWKDLTFSAKTNVKSNRY